jgi:hypothetical protein
MSRQDLENERASLIRELEKVGIYGVRSLVKVPMKVVGLAYGWTPESLQQRIKELDEELNNIGKGT